MRKRLAFMNSRVLQPCPFSSASIFPLSSIGGPYMHRRRGELRKRKNFMPELPADSAYAYVPLAGDYIHLPSRDFFLR